MPDVYLTFDDGPYDATLEVLDVLRERRATATFFLQMRRSADRSAQFAIIRRMITEGHQLANHGVDHDPATRQGYQQGTTIDVRRDFEENDAILRTMLRDRQQMSLNLLLARLPGDGRFEEAYVTMIVNELRVPHVGWDMEFSRNGVMRHISHRDWQGVEGVAATRSGPAAAQNVLLLHDLHWRGRGPLLSRLIAKLQETFTVRSMAAPAPNLPCVRYPGR